jgi:septal ring factor EnvC (AmiA/AmiB activator)
MIAPVNGPITQRFGEDPAFYLAHTGTNGHNGIDFGVPVGTPVVAPKDGNIIQVGSDANNGEFIVMQSDAGYTYWLIHLSAQQVNNRDRVNQGQQIALSGNTGLSTGPHLHLGLYPPSPDRNNGFRGAIDPEPLIEIAEPTPQPTQTIPQGDEEMIQTEDQARKMYALLRPNAQADQGELDQTVGKRTYEQFVNDAQAEVASRDQSLSAEVAQIDTLVQQAAQVPQLQQQVTDLTSQAQQLTARVADLTAKLAQDQTAPDPVPTPVVVQPTETKTEGKNMLQALAPYSKALIAAAGVILTGLNVLYGSNPSVQMAITAATALGVYHAPNKAV